MCSRRAGEPASRDQRYIASRTTSYAAGDGLDIVYSHSTSSLRLVPVHQSSLLGELTELRTIDGHVRRLVERGWAEDEADPLEKELYELRDKGFLISTSDIVAGIRGTQNSSQTDTPSGVGLIAWVTRDRPDSLLASIHSAADMIRQFDRSIPFAVLDDTDDPESERDKRGGLGRYTRETGKPVLFAGKAEKRRFAASLARASGEELDPAIVEFALFDDEKLGFTSGANRNALLLAAAGEAVVNPDDDTLFRFARVCDDPGGLQFSSASDPTMTRFFADREDLLNGVSLEAVDIISWHEKVLGRSMPGCLAAAEGEPHLDGISSGFAEILRSGRGRVRATVAGHCGDSGIGFPGLPIYLTGQARDGAMRSKRSFSTAMSTREILRAVERLTVSEGYLLMGSHIGLDNTALLPPFCPVLRGSDTLFGVTLRSCAEEALLGFLPFAAQHTPPARAAYQDGELDRISSKLTNLLSLLTWSFRQLKQNAGTAARMRVLGDHLMRVGGLSDSAFRDAARGVWLVHIGARIGALEERLDEYDGRPRYWRDAVLRVIEAFRRLGTSDDLDIPSDLRAGRSPEEARELTRRLVRRYGELLYWWPVIWETAKELKEAGAGMLVEL